RALGVLLKAVKRRPELRAQLFAGIPHDLEYLSVTSNRIDWTDWCQILRNAGSIWSLQELSDLNEAFTRSPTFSSMGVIARLLFNTRGLFDWICKRAVGAGN